MSTATGTYEGTYTVADINRVVDRFAADYGMIAEATGLRTRQEIDKHVSDIKIYAAAKYLVEIDVTLFDKSGKEIQAAKYKVSDAASGWTNQQPGNNMWPRTPDGHLLLTLKLSDKWVSMGQEAREEFHRENGLNWSPCSRNLTHQTLTGQLDRRYVSNGYGMEKLIFKAV